MADTSEQQNQQITQAVADTGAFSAVITRIHAKETSGSTDPGPATGETAVEDWKPRQCPGQAQSIGTAPSYDWRGRTQMLPYRLTRGVFALASQGLETGTEDAHNVLLASQRVTMEAQYFT